MHLFRSTLPVRVSIWTLGFLFLQFRYEHRYHVAANPYDKVWYTHGCPEFSCWNMHGTYLCMLGTNVCAIDFKKKAWDLNPELTFIERLISLYDLQNGEGFSTLIDMEGGFSLSPEVIKDKERMKPICDEIVAVGNYCDDILEVFKTI